MDSQQPQNLVSEPVLTSKQVEVVENKPKSSPVLPVLLVILVLLLAASTAFLYYQNMQLKNMLASYQSQPTASPTPVPTTDPTANWKTYTNSQFHFSIKTPTDSNITTPTDELNIGMIDVDNKLAFFFGDRRKSELKQIENLDPKQIKTNPSELPSFNFLGSNFLVNRTVNGDGGPSQFPNCVIGSSTNTYYFDDPAHQVLIYLYTRETLSCDKNGKQVTLNDFDENINFSKNVLSTFKFTQ